jgi:orotate phosphoribosyltransferase-like protein
MGRGRPKQVSHDEIIDAARDLDQIIFGTADIADEVGLSVNRVRQIMLKLETKGVFSHQSINGTHVFYFDCLRES